MTTTVVKMGFYDKFIRVSDLKTLARDFLLFINENSEEAAFQHVLQWLIDLIEVDYDLQLSDCKSEKLGSIIANIAKHFNGIRYNVPKFRKMRLFTLQLCTLTDTITGKSWFIYISEFLVDMADNPILRETAAFLAVQFLCPLDTLRSKFSNDIDNAIATLANCARTMFDWERLHGTTMEKAESTSVLDAVCENLLILSEIGLSFPKIAMQITDFVCNLHELSDAFYSSEDYALAFYKKCLMTKNCKITCRALSSLQAILTSEVISLESKTVVIKFIMKKYIQSLLYNLLSEQSSKVIMGTLNLIQAMHNSIDTITDWDFIDFPNIFWMTFHKQGAIRTLAGKIVIEYLRKLYEQNEAKIVLSILDHCNVFTPNVEKIIYMIDAIWDFSYIHNIDNILILYRSDDIPPKVKNMLSFIVVAIAQKMLTEDKNDYYTLNILKKLPLIFRELEESAENAYGILIEILSYIDLNKYKEIYIGHSRYLIRLVQSLKNVFLSGSDFYLLVSVYFTLANLAELEFSEAKIAISLIIDDIFDQFCEIRSKWKEAQFSNEFPEMEIVISIYYRMSIILKTSPSIELLDIEKQNILYDIFTEDLISTDIIRRKTSQENIVTSIFIESFANILKRRILLWHKSNSILNEPILIERFQYNFHKFTEYLTEIIKSGAILHIYLAENSFRSMISMLLCTQSTHMLKAGQMIFKLTTNLYINLINFLLINVFTDIIEEHNTPFEDIVVSKFRILERKRNILKFFNFLHTEYTPIPVTVIIWKIFAYLGTTNSFDKEIADLMTTILKYKTTNEDEGSRFCKIFALTIYNINDEYLQTFLVKSYIVLQNIYHPQMISILSGTILINLIHALATNIKCSSPDASDENVNRLNKLIHMNIFIQEMDMEYCKEVYKETLTIAKKHVMTKLELHTLSIFQSLLLNKPIHL